MACPTPQCAAVPTGAGDAVEEGGEARYKEFEKMDDVLGQAWVEDAEEVWRLAPVRSVSSDGGTLVMLQPDGTSWVDQIGLVAMHSLTVGRCLVSNGC